MKFDPNNRYHRYLAAAALIWAGSAVCAAAGNHSVGGAVVLTIILGIVYVLREAE